MLNRIFSFMPVTVLLIITALAVTLSFAQGNMPQNSVLVKGGQYTMGHSWNPAFPEHSVKVGDFYISKTEVTQKEWRDVMRTIPSYSKGDNLPVESISFYDAVQFCNTKSNKEKRKPVYTINMRSKDPNNTSNNDTMKYTIIADWSADGYRLPTEAEWIWASMGGVQGKNYKFSGSDNADEVAWHGGSVSARPSPAAGKKANELGIYDMTGNVWEWTWNWFGHKTKGNFENPTGPVGGSSRVLLGGACGGQKLSGNTVSGSSKAVIVESALSPVTRSNQIGFRWVVSASARASSAPEIPGKLTVDPDMKGASEKIADAKKLQTEKRSLLAGSSDRGFTAGETELRSAESFFSRKDYKSALSSAGRAVIAYNSVKKTEAPSGGAAGDLKTQAEESIAGADRLRNEKTAKHSRHSDFRLGVRNLNSAKTSLRVRKYTDAKIQAEKAASYFNKLD